MIEQELLFLGLLRESPRHGYEIKKKIKEILALSAGIEPKSIYYPLQILENKGLLIKRINKQGRRPERFVYALTPKGESRFKKLLAESLLNFKRPQFSLDLSLYFLHYLKPEAAKRRLRARMRVLNRIITGLKQTINSVKKKSPLSMVRILEHNLQMVETESKFLENLIERL